MISVQVQCPSCGVLVRVPPTEIVITGLARRGVPGRVALACPQCRQRGSVAADAEVLNQLRDGGCRLAPDLASRAHHPAGTNRPFAEGQVAPPLGWDDLLEFHDLLQTDDWFDRLTELVD